MPSYNEKRDALERARSNSPVKETAQTVRAVASGPAFMAPVRALTLGVKLRRAARDHKSSAWTMAFVVAISCDLSDLIPIAGWMISFFFRPLIFIFLFGRGTWKLRIIFWILMTLDFFPIISIIPMTTACVFYAHHKSKELYEKSIEFDKELSKAEAYA